MLDNITQYLNKPEAVRNFAEGLTLLEATNPTNQIQLKALKKYIDKKYISQQIKLSLYIALKKYTDTKAEKKPTPLPITHYPLPIINGASPVSLYAILDTDPLSIRQLITDTGKMNDEAFAARNALFYLKSNQERYEYALKATQLYRLSAENWRKVRTFRESGALPPELMMSQMDIKKEILDKIQRKKYLIERSYRIKSWIDGKTKPPPQFLEKGIIKPEWLTKYTDELTTIVEELDAINQYLQIE